MNATDRPSAQPLDPRSEQGRQTAARLENALAEIRLRIAARRRTAGRDQQAA